MFTALHSRCRQEVGKCQETKKHRELGKQQEANKAEKPVNGRN